METKFFVSIKSERGFSIVELLIVTVVFAVVISMSTDIFTSTARNVRQQAKMSENQMANLVGLELLRADIEQAGYGLPWSYADPIPGYSEATAPLIAASYNDTASTPPRAIVSGNDLASFVINGSDYLVVKSIVSGMNATSQRWSYITSTGVVRDAWGVDDLTATNRVVIIRPDVTDTIKRQLVMPTGGPFFTQFGAAAGFPVRAADVIYGVDSQNLLIPNLRVPFNRSDYYVRRPADISQSCAPNIGVLFKASFNQGAPVGINEFIEYPVLDCVADLQMVYRLDMNEDDSAGTTSNAGGSTVVSSEGSSATDVQATFNNAELIRKRLKEVRVYILTHEGKMDPQFTYPNGTVTITDPDFGTIRSFDLATIIGGTWQNYRWKITTLVVKTRLL